MIYLWEHPPVQALLLKKKMEKRYEWSKTIPKRFLKIVSPNVRPSPRYKISLPPVPLDPPLFQLDTSPTAWHTTHAQNSFSKRIFHVPSRSRHSTHEFGARATFQSQLYDHPALVISDYVPADAAPGEFQCIPATSRKHVILYYTSRELCSFMRESGCMKLLRRPFSPRRARNSRRRELCVSRGCFVCFFFFRFRRLDGHCSVGRVFEMRGRAPGETLRAYECKSESGFFVDSALLFYCTKSLFY